MDKFNQHHYGRAFAHFVSITIFSLYTHVQRMVVRKQNQKLWPVLSPDFVFKCQRSRIMVSVFCSKLIQYMYACCSQPKNEHSRQSINHLHLKSISLCQRAIDQSKESTDENKSDRETGEPNANEWWLAVGYETQWFFRLWFHFD